MKLFRLFSLRFLLLWIFVPFVWLFAEHLGWLTHLEYTTLNWRFKVRGEIEAPVKLMYVDLDTDAVRMLGERPMPRVHFARAVHGLFDYGGARVVGIDAIFSSAAYSALVDKEKVKRDNAAFREVIDKSPGLVLGAGYTGSSSSSIDFEKNNTFGFPYIYKGYTDPSLNSEPEKPEFSLIGKNGGNLGLVNIAYQYSPGSTPRWLPMFVDTPQRRYLELGLEMLRVFYGVPKDNVEISPDSILLRSETGHPILKVPLTDSQLLEVNWFSAWISEKNPRVSLKSVVEAVERIEHGSQEQELLARHYLKRFEGSIVLIGAVDPLLNDLRPEPFTSSPVPKVGVQGNLIKTLVTGQYLDRPYNIAVGLITFLVTLLVAGLAVISGRYSSLCKTGSFGVLVLYTFSCFYLFSELHWVLPVVTPIGAAFSTAFLVILLQLFHTEKQRGRVQDLFGNYLSRSVVDEIVRTDQLPKLGGIEQNITAFFSDVENFSLIAESVGPAHLVEFVNEYLTDMTDIIHEEGGTLDKYVGDGIVAIFGAPLYMEDHALRACRVACRINEEQKRLCEKWKQDSRKWPEVVFSMRTRVGINTGNAIIGNMGSHNRFNYTMMGENVNVASRCEQSASLYGIYSLVADSTRMAAEFFSNEVVFRYLDKIIPKGHSLPVKVHEVVGFRESLTNEALECVGLFEDALEHYFSMEWDEAIALFDKADELERHLPQQPSILKVRPSAVFLNRCQLLKVSSPPEDWNGVFDNKLLKRFKY